MLPDSFWYPKPKDKRTKVDILEDKIADIEEKINNTENYTVMERLEKQKEELEKKLGIAEESLSKRIRVAGKKEQR